ncbi:MAG: YdcF family protein [Burkholderiales bacterium]
MANSCTQLLSAFLLPPLNFLLLGGIGLFSLKSRPILGKALILFAFALLYFCSTSFFTLPLLKLIEVAPLRQHDTSAQAIVVLGAGTSLQAPDYGGDTVNRLGLERLRYAAKLYRATQKPILVAGGSPQGSALSEAAQMKGVLTDEFRVPVQWEETASRTTYENALRVREILKAAGINRIYLVTHAWHMRRAVLAFESADFSVIPAPTGFAGPVYAAVYLPTPQGLTMSYLFMHEALGWLWYQIQLRI